MRLAVVSPFVDRRHGTERALAELLERLARGYHCEIHLYAHRVQDLSLDTARPSSRPSNSGTIFWRKVPSLPGPHLFQFVSWMVCNSICRFWDHRVRGLHCELVLSPGINCLDADVVIVHAFFHRLLELAREAQSGLRPNSLRRLHRRAYYALLTRLERRIYANPNVTLAAVSQRTAVLLNQHFQRHDVAVIPNAVDTTQFSPSARLALRAESRRRRNLHEQDFVLLLIGNDWRVKGLETILRAVSALPALPLQLLIVGDEPPDPFRHLATHLGVLDRCRFEPSRVDVLDFYAAADLYVSPSLEDSFGLPVAEAMACGLPVITSARAGVSELIQNGADGFVLRDLRDSHELTGLLEELFRDPDRRQRVGKASARRALEWTWDHHAAATFQLLQQVLRRK